MGDLPKDVSPQSPFGSEVLKALLESLQHRAPLSDLAEEGDADKKLPSPHSEGPPPGSLPMSQAFLGPNIWDHTISLDGGALTLQYMDLDDFLSQEELAGLGLDGFEMVRSNDRGAGDLVRTDTGAVESNGGGVGGETGGELVRSNTVGGELVRSDGGLVESNREDGGGAGEVEHSDGGDAGVTGQVVQSNAKTSSSISSSAPENLTRNKNDNNIDNRRTARPIARPIAQPIDQAVDRSIDEEVADEEVDDDDEEEEEEEDMVVEVEFTPSPGDLELSSIPGQDLFDFRKRRFTPEELKPQPIIKKARKVFVPDDCKDERYWQRRSKNNRAAQRSREARRLKENQIAVRAAFLETENSALRREITELRAIVNKTSAKTGASKSGSSNTD